MGWTFTQKPEDRKAFVDSQLTWSAGRFASRVLKSRLVGSTYYAAVERTAPGITLVFGMVVLTKTERGPRGWFGTKPIDESMGPAEARCPESILKLLSPTDDAPSRAWRERCLAYAKSRRARPAPKAGDRVRYGGKVYTLHEPAGPRRGWAVWGDSTIYRMNARQLAQAEPVTEEDEQPA